MNISLLCCVLFANPVKAASPKEVAHTVAQNIVNSTQFTLVDKPASWSQKDSYIIRFNDITVEPNQTYLAKTKVVLDLDEFENQRDPSQQKLLALSHTPGKLKVFHNDSLVLESTSKKNQFFKKVDYQLNHYASGVALKFVDGDTIQLEFTPFDAKPNIILAPIYADTGMRSRKTKFLFELAGKKAPFALSKQSQSSTAKWALQTRPIITDIDDKLDFSDFRYFTGTILDAMQQLSDYYDTDQFLAYMEKHQSFFFTHYPNILKQREELNVIAGPFSHADRFMLLDDFGPQTAAFINSLAREGRNLSFYKEKQMFLKRALEQIQYIPRLEDGTFTRVTPYPYTVQSDDLFMGGLFLIRASQYLNDKALLEEALLQILNFHKHLFDEPTGLYRHAYYASIDEKASTIWGRGVGWMAMVYVELLDIIPPEHPKYQHLLQNFIVFCDAMVTYQNKTDGRWHQVLNDDTSYLETSVTAMFLRALATGVAEGWLTDPKYKKSAHLAWKGLTSQIAPNGDVKGIVRGTPIFPYPEDYKKHTPRLNDPRGLGAVIYATIAMDKMLKVYPDGQ
ncbi:glycoside hydrolase family 88/105 protein [Catenovulum agarivorans]|uniref:glycoside hydrolase family 88/105 protein n=1 Tax=Catenovulum agarivorans TaxID=1172192 RepID=UPI0002D5B4DA|nr:glycoside hydrolase family 88 protein [Catenovulum agarivorans]